MNSFIFLFFLFFFFFICPLHLNILTSTSNIWKQNKKQKTKNSHYYFIHGQTFPSIAWLHKRSSSKKSTPSISCMFQSSFILQNVTKCPLTFHYIYSNSMHVSTVYHRAGPAEPRITMSQCRIICGWLFKTVSVFEAHLNIPCTRHFVK